MAAEFEPERFITVSEMELVVDGTVVPVGQSGGGRIVLNRRFAIPAGEYPYRHRLYADAGGLLSESERTVRVLDGSHEPRTDYAVEFSPVAEPAVA